MINVYCTILNITLNQVKNIIEDFFPENISSIIESGTVFLSDGVLFECSVESSHVSGLYLSAIYKSDINQFVIMIEELKKRIEANNGIYDIEYETINNNEFESYYITHPYFSKRFIPPSDLA